MNKMKKFLAVMLAATMVCTVAACGGNADSDGKGAPIEITGEESKTEENSPATEEGSTAAEATEQESSSAETPAEQKPTVDRSGAEITLPDKVESIVVMAPSFAETLIDLGCAGNIVAVDTQTIGYAYAELSSDLPAFDMMVPDTEQIAALRPDVVFVSGMSGISGTDPYADLGKLGICVVYIPSSTSIQGIQEDIAFIAACMGKNEEGKQIIEKMNAEINRIAEIGKGITEKKTVYFEIAAAPYAYSFGSGTFLNEMIELIGAKNLFADQEGWMPVEIESVVAANPDVILTSVNYIDDPVGEILAREGWEGVAAVKDKNVYLIDSQSSNLPNENIVKALQEMAIAVYPEAYEK